MSRKTLVAGASGLIGGALIDALLERGDDVHALARFRNPDIRTSLEARGVKTFALDVGKQRYEDVEGLRRDYDLVIHEIALMIEAEDDRPYTWETNTYSVPRLIEFCVDSGVFVVASTGGVYPASDEPKKETDGLAAAGTYGATKIAMEALGTYVCGKYARPLALLRYHWPYSETKGMISDVAQKISRGEPIEINRINRSIVHPTWIGDTVQMTLAAAERAGVPPYIVNIAGEQPIEREELVKHIAAGLGCEAEVRHADLPRISHIADLTKMHRDLGRCEVSLEDGISRTARALRKGK